MVTAAGVSDNAAGIHLLSRIAAGHPRITKAWADSGYRTIAIDHGARLGIDVHVVQRAPGTKGFKVLPRRWTVETAFFSIKATMLDGRVLRSHRLEDIDQEVYALLTVYQALVRIADDATAGRPHLDPDRIGFTVALDAARDQVTTAGGVLTSGAAVLTGAIGRAVLDNLLSVRRRQRIKARTRKNPTSKYSKNSAQHPATAQHYTLNAGVMVMEHGLTARPKR